MRGDRVWLFFRDCFLCSSVILPSSSPSQIGIIPASCLSTASGSIISESCPPGSHGIPTVKNPMIRLMSLFPEILPMASFWRQESRRFLKWISMSRQKCLPRLPLRELPHGLPRSGWRSVLDPLVSARNGFPLETESLCPISAFTLKCYGYSGCMSPAGILLAPPTH